MQRKFVLLVIASMIAAVTAALVAVPRHTDAEEPRTFTLANSPDDSSPSPEEILREAGVELTIPALSEVVTDAGQPAELRYWAAIALGRTGDSAALQPLVAILGATDANVRYGAVAGLGELGPTARGPAVGALAPALHDVEAGVRAAAVQALGRIGGNEALSLLVQKLEDLSEPAAEIRMNAAFQLGRLEMRAARPPLRHALDDGAAGVRVAAALGLARMGNRSAVPALVEAALDPMTEEWLRVDAIEALEDLSGEAFQYVKPYSAPTTPQERAAALESIEAWWSANQGRYQ